jgi:hypothetical protein
VSGSRLRRAGFVERWALALVGALAVAVAHPVCNLLFRCGCGWLGPAHCNIHQAVAPYCPWCTGRFTFIVVGAVWLAGAWSGVALGRRRLGGGGALGGGLVGLVAAMLVSGWATAALTGYPHLLWR